MRGECSPRKTSDREVRLLQSMFLAEIARHPARHLHIGKQNIFELFCCRRAARRWCALSTRRTPAAGFLLELAMPRLSACHRAIRVARACIAIKAETGADERRADRHADFQHCTAGMGARATVFASRRTPQARRATRDNRACGGSIFAHRARIRARRSDAAENRPTIRQNRAGADQGRIRIGSIRPPDACRARR